MKKLNKKSLCIKEKRKAIYGGVAFITLMAASSISCAMNEEGMANELSCSRSLRMNHIDRNDQKEKDVQKLFQKYEDVAIEHLKEGDIKLAEFSYNAGLEEASKKMIKSTVQTSPQNSWNSNSGIENDETQMSPRSLYLKSVELKLDGDFLRSTEYLKKAADLNQSNACYDLAHQYLKGINGLERSMERYVKYLQRAERLGNQNAINEVSVLKKSLNEETQYLDESFKNSIWRKINLGAKKVDIATQNINLFGPVVLTFLDIFYEDKVKMAEYALSCCNIFGGLSKIVDGVSATALTDDYQHLWKSGFGVIQLGSVYLQFESIAEREKIRKERKEVETEKIRIRKELSKLNEQCEQNQFEDSFKEIENRRKELLKQQCAVDNRCVCTALAERVITDSIDEYQKTPNANFLAIMMGKTFKGFVKSLPMLFRQNITANKEEVAERINNFVEGLRDEMKPALFSKLDSVFKDIKNYTSEYIIDYPNQNKNCTNL